MILTCPLCTMRYIVSEGAIGPKGRKVRCANCGHEWQQQPEEGLDETLFGPDDAFERTDARAAPVTEEVPAPLEEDIPPPPSFVQEEPAAAEEEASDFERMLKREMAEDIAIPEGVKPQHEDIVLPRSKTELSLGSRGGFIAAGIFYLILLGIFLLLQPQISRAWPASNLVYGWFGMSPALPGEGLALDGLQARITNGEIIMTGNIINLRNEPAEVPAVMAMIVDESEQILEQVLIVPPSATVEGEGQLSFDVTYPSVPTGALNVNFAFTYIKPKPADVTAEAEEKEVSSTPDSSPEKADHEPAEETH